MEISVFLTSHLVNGIVGMKRRNYSKWPPVGNSNQTGFFNEMHFTSVYEGKSKVAAVLSFKGAVTRLCACAASFLVRRTVFQVFARVRKSLSIVPFR